jgi:hypothetical protein
MTCPGSPASSFRATAAVFVAAFALSVAGWAQTGLPFSGGPPPGLGNIPGVSFPTPGAAPARIAGPRVHHFGNRGFGRSVPIFFGADGFYDSGEPGTLVINNIVPPPEAPKTPAFEEQPPAAPLIIERDGDGWVRKRLVPTAPGQKTAQTEAETRLLPARAPQPLPDTTLVFRDGHRESVATYMIFGGALYHSTPAWAPQQQVKLSQLNLPATEEANRQRGVVFRLPNAPNEVVTRP